MIEEGFAPVPVLRSELRGSEPIGVAALGELADEAGCGTSVVKGLVKLGVLVEADATLWQNVILRGTTVIPMIVLGFSPGAVNTYLLVVYLYATFVHANLGWRFPFVEKFLVTPRFHHWHHGIEREAPRVVAAADVLRAAGGVHQQVDQEVGFADLRRAAEDGLNHRWVRCGDFRGETSGETEVLKVRGVGLFVRSEAEIDEQAGNREPRLAGVEHRARRPAFAPGVHDGGRHRRTEPAAAGRLEHVHVRPVIDRPGILRCAGARGQARHEHVEALLPEVQHHLLELVPYQRVRPLSEYRADGHFRESEVMVRGEVGVVIAGEKRGAR